MTRAEKVAEAQRLRAKGLTYREIGERMGGYKVPTVHAWLSDPDRSLEVARKNSYRGTCEDCGATTSGSDGRGPNAPRKCRDCQVRWLGAFSAERAKPHRELIERLWAEGKTSREIGAIVGWAGKWAPHMIVNCRNRGYNLPHRRSPEQIARMTVGAAERMAKARAVVAANRKAAA